MINNITTIFVFIDDFIKLYQNNSKEVMRIGNKHRNREGKLSLSEMMTIMICFHFSNFKTFKHYYKYCIGVQYKHLFSDLMSYSRFVKLQPRLMIPITLLLHILRGEETGLYFIDSTKLEICHKKRTSGNKVFKGLAEVGKSSYGWFLGFKLHMVINNKGQIIAVKITKGNVDDREPVEELLKNLKGSAYGDKGYIKHNLFLKLYDKGLKFIYGIRSNMKNRLFTLFDKIMLRKRSLIESAFNILKNQMNLEHTRHRSPVNFLVNTLSCLAAYCFKTTKKHLKTIKIEELKMINA